ncbi:hypothetical protein STSP2_00655 [Anaerohalosphaera lusitana]|uniref:Uncharacterized protein n=1 Tax=Anaerohalosphaera lusitana TaxID=1936003 RepID=A0A1U9NI96_9BACT|nr:hypothetical protein [Anaerohalosphaera lusitana]AQT67507.1 hypothetical protein STSP2_00655 [Anaerohalosphaera lusitana]
MAKQNKSVKWSDVKKVLSNRDRKELLALIKDLYSLNKQNKTFVQARYSLIDQVRPYKAIIKDCISIDLDRPIDLAGAKKAISQYRKAVGDHEGVLELMVFYVECGNDLTCEYGDINEQFYYSLESVFEKALKTLTQSDDDTVEKFLPRLDAVVEKAQGIGWGYYDTILSLLCDYFPPDE